MDHIRRILGHATEEQTRACIKTAVEDLVAAHRKHSPIEQLARHPSALFGGEVVVVGEDG